MYYADVVVCGGGVAGVMAAAAAARRGASAIVIERNGSLGGTLTSSLIGNILDSYGKTGMFGDYVAKVGKILRDGTANMFEAEKYVLDEYCREYGVKVLFYTQLTGCEVSDGKITKINCYTYDKRVDVEGKIFIDATGNGTLACLAGCKYDIGNSEGKTQPMSMCAIVAGISDKSCIGWENREAFKALMDRAGIDISMGFPNTADIGGGLCTLNINHIYGIRFDDVENISEAVMKCREEVYSVVEKLRNSGDPAVADIKLVCTPELIGIREGRRIHGLYTVSLDDIINGTKHDDAVCTVRYWVDIHALDDSGNKSFSGNDIKNQAYDIPFRAMLPVDCDNLILSGRCISGDFFAHASYRVVGNTGAIGEAAGKMAAESLKHGSPIKETPYVQ